jgi:S1-C subfamily serine protease
VGSPGQQAGLQPGDLILALDSVPVRGAQDTLGQIATHKPGSRIAIHGKRGGREFDVHAQVSERPRNN